MTELHHKIQSSLVGWVFLPLLAAFAAEHFFGVTILPFIACLLLFYVARVIYHLYESFTRPETVEERNEIEKEVARMEGRCLRFNNNFEITVPADFEVHSSSEDSFTLKHKPSGLERIIHFDLEDKARVAEVMNQAIRWIRKQT